MLRYGQQGRGRQQICGMRNGDSEKKCTGELENEGTEGNVGVRVTIARCGVHAKRSEERRVGKEC